MNPGEYIAASVVLEETGDVVNDAVYKANIKVCERFNIVLEPIELAGNSLDPVKAAVLAGDNAYNLRRRHNDRQPMPFRHISRCKRISITKSRGGRLTR